jgi:hypothetical protein
VALFGRQENIVEIYRRESSVVGRVLGETREKYQATTKESNWKNKP